MRRVVLVAWLVFVTTAAAAEPAPSNTTVQAEGGAEIDTNVQRVETGPGLDTREITASVGRLGAKLDHRGRLLGGGYVGHFATYARLVGDADAQSESVALVAGDLKWLHAVGERPVSVGISVLAADAIALDTAADCEARSRSASTTTMSIVVRVKLSSTAVVGSSSSAVHARSSSLIWRR